MATVGLVQTCSNYEAWMSKQGAPQAEMRQKRSERNRSESEMEQVQCPEKKRLVVVGISADINTVSNISSIGHDILLMETIKAVIAQVLQFASQTTPSLNNNYNNFFTCPLYLLTCHQ